MSNDDSAPVRRAGPGADGAADRGRRRLAAYGGWAALGGPLLLAQVVRAPEPLGLDQGLFGCAGLSLLRGEAPYRDVWDSKPPGLFCLYALAFWLFGPGVAAIRILDGAGAVAGAAVVGWLARRWSLCSPRTAALVHILYFHAALFGGYWATGQAETFAGPLVGAAYGLLPCAAGERQGIRCSAAGALLGAAALLKLPMLLFALPVLVWIGLRRAWRPLLAIAGGLAAAILPVLAWLHSIEALDAFVEMVVVYSPLYLEAAAPVHFGAAAWAALSAAAGTAGGLLLPSAAAALAMLGRRCAALARAHRGGHRRAPAAAAAAGGSLTLGGPAWAPCWWVGALAVLAAQRQFAGYHFLPLLPPAALLTGALWRGGARGAVSPVPGARRWLRWAVLSASLLLGANDARAASALYAPNVRYLAGLLSQDAFLRQFATGTFQPAANAELGAYLRERTQADDRILVWGLAPDIYFYARRRASTPYCFHHLLLTDAPISRRLPGLRQRQQRLLDSLAASPPAFILIGHHDANPFEPLPSDEQLRRFPALDRFVRERYALVRTAGTFAVMQRRERASEGY